MLRRGLEFKSSHCTSTSTLSSLPYPACPFNIILNLSPDFSALAAEYAQDILNNLVAG